MFDTPENRYIYEDAMRRHEGLMDEESSNGRAYRLGYIGKCYSENPTLSYEYWRAGRDNARMHYLSQPNSLSPPTISSD